MRIWPGPDESLDAPPPDPRWSPMNQVPASIPAGRWTSYSDPAQVIGSHQVPVGNRLASRSAPNAHRVLRLDGGISPDFRWPDPDRTDKPMDVLKAEGVVFGKSGKASAAQRMTATDLARMMDLDETADAVE